MVGAHIRALKGGRWSHAIDCGDETVIHLADGAATGPLRVRRSYRPQFVFGAEAVEIVTHRERTFPANEIVARAYSRIADPALASVFRDSEAFAEWCTTGRLPAAGPDLATSVPGVAAATPPSPAAPAPNPAPQARPATQRKPAAQAKPAKRIARKPAAKERTAAKAAARAAGARATRRPVAKARRSAKKTAKRAARKRR